jgi:hypothetical protein
VFDLFDKLDFVLVLKCQDINVTISVVLMHIPRLYRQ